MIAAWIVLPLVLGLLSAGLGLLVERVIGRPLSFSLLLPLGFAALITIGGITTLFSWLAPATTAIICAFAILGAVLTYPWRGRSPGRWAMVAALGVYLVYLAPVLFSGEAGFTGYIKLDDTATWLAFTDHILEFGRSTASLAPSSHEAVVQINLSAGYPVGTFIPLAVGSELTATDSAWLIQPYMAFVAALMALSLYRLAGRVLERPAIVAAVAFVAAQPALLIGFAWWGGVKEVVTAQVLAVLAAVAVGLAEPPRGESGGPARLTDRLALRQVLPGPVIAGSALIGVMGFGGLPWLFGIGLGVVLLMAWRARAEIRLRDFRSGTTARTYLVRLGVLLVGLLLIGGPTIIASGSFFSPTQEGLTSGEELGNLFGPLSPAQYTGPWPVADFRESPDSSLLTALLVTAALIAFAFGVWAAIVRRAAGLLVFAFGTGLGSAIVWLAGSPWIQGKALATGTASFLVVALVGIATLIASPRTFDLSRLFRNLKASSEVLSGRLKLAGVLLLVVPLGVLASNVKAFGDVWLAPKEQLAELERIGEEFAGQGPALMTEYQVYGVRHFLRKLDAEGVSELRRRLIPRLDGQSAEKGEWVDTDNLETDPAREGLFTYRTLIIRRSPQQSRPPTPYRLVQSGRFFEVWQLEEGFDPASLIARLPLGEGIDPGAVPSCERIGELTNQVGPDGRLIASTRQPVAVARLDSVTSGWTLDPAAGTVIPSSSGRASGTISTPRPGRWQVFLGGSARGEVSVLIDGVEVGSASSRLGVAGEYVELGPVELAAGGHRVEISYERGGLLDPGGRGRYEFPFGPLVLAYAPASDRLVEVPGSRYRELCDRRLDWVEAYPPG